MGYLIPPSNRTAQAVPVLSARTPTRYRAGPTPARYLIPQPRRHIPVNTTDPSIATVQPPEMKRILASRVILLAPDLSGIWLNQRNMDAPLCPGRWQAPGGTVEEGENPLSAIVRETEEEAGLWCFHEDFIPFDVTGFNSRHLGGCFVQIFWFVNLLKGGVVPRNTEPGKAGEFKLVPWHKIKGERLIKGMAECIPALRELVKTLAVSTLGHLDETLTAHNRQMDEECNGI